MTDTELRVSKIENGTVIDHISGGQALNVLAILGIDGTSGEEVSVDAEDGEDVQRLPAGDVVDDGAVFDLGDAEFRVGHSIRSSSAIRTGTPLCACSK